MNAFDTMKKNLSEKIKDYTMHLAYIQDLITVYNLTFEKEIISEEYKLVTTCGLYDSFSIALARLYDKSKQAETIPNLLDKCIKNAHLIDDKEYLIKLKKFKDRLSTEEDISAAIETLSLRRDKLYAHNDTEYFGKKISSDKSYLPMYQIWFLVAFTKEVLLYLSEEFNIEMEKTKFEPKFW